MRHALVLVALLAGALALPHAEAEHVYSHRFVLEGRLVGGNGLPIPAQRVEFFAEGDDFVQPCRDRPNQPFTDEWGDFRFCFHKHDLQPSTVVGVTAGNATVRKIMDTAFRHSVVSLVDENATGIAPAGWNETFRITGKVWRAGNAVLEDVAVYGVAIPNASVVITLRGGEVGEGSRYEVVTDGFGDFDATIRLLENVTASNVTVEVQSMGVVRDAALDLSDHRMVFGIRLPPDGPVRIDNVVARAPATAQGEPQPGASAPTISPALFVGLAIVGVAVLAFKKREK